MASFTKIETSKIVELADCNFETRSLLTGTLLKWMDIIACLSAEKQANVPCVTASVDDLRIEKRIMAGQVVNLKAWINRVFNTSMEVEVSVDYEDFTEQEKHSVCKAYFTFVTQPNVNGSKNTVEPVEPVDQEDKIQYTLANERKRLRLDYRNSLKVMKESKSSVDLGQNPTISSSSEIQDDAFADKVDSVPFVRSKDTYCECVEIVLPQHANHHRTTFGGQLMAWVEAAGTISARRLCKVHPRLIAVDEVFFRAPSKVGDRVVIKACVNNTFSKSFEVGVRVEAYAIGGERRHIQSAYLTFVAPDANGNPTMLPLLEAADKLERARKARADARVRMRRERRTILSQRGPSVAAEITKSNQRVMSYKNILALMELYNNPNWSLVLKTGSISMFQCKVDHVLSIRIEADLKVPADKVYKLLSDDTQRNLWDMSVSHVTVHQELRKDEDYILHYVMMNLLPRENVKGDDFVILASRRKPMDAKDIYMLAYRSVLVDSLPHRLEYHRAEVRCSGFILKPHVHQGFVVGCKLVYLNKLTDHVYQYVKHDLKGANDAIVKRIMNMTEILHKSI